MCEHNVADTSIFEPGAVSSAASAFGNARSIALKNGTVATAARDIINIYTNVPLIASNNPNSDVVPLPPSPKMSPDSSVETPLGLISTVENASDLTNIPAEPEEWSDCDTVVIVTPSYHAQFRTLSAPHKDEISSSCEVYMECMLIHKLGYPLYSPEPNVDQWKEEHRRKGVSPGDVVSMTPDGGYEFFFNALCTAEDPLNPNDLPNDCVVTSLCYPENVLRKPKYIQETMISNMKVNTQIDKATGDISYDCSKNMDKGALLSMPHGAIEEFFMDEKCAQKCIEEYAARWYKYIISSRRRYVDRHSLCLVTRCIKSDFWGIATFDQDVNERHGNLVLGKPANRYCGSFLHPPMIWTEHGEASSFRTGPSTDAEDVPNKLQNQCLFLRAYRISLQENIWDELRAESWPSHNNGNGKRPPSPEDPDERRANKRGRNKESGSDEHSSQSHGISYTTLGLENTIFQPLKEVNEWLLSQNPEAIAAITHDDIWIDASGEGKFNAEYFLETVQQRYIVCYNDETKTCTLETCLEQAGQLSTQPVEGDSYNRLESQVHMLPVKSDVWVPTQDVISSRWQASELTTPVVVRRQGSIKDIQKPQNDIFWRIKPFTVPERLCICLHIAICLAFLHSKGEVHGSVSPGSVEILQELPTSNTTMMGHVVTLRNQGLYAALAKDVKFMEIMEPTRYMPPEYVLKDEVYPTKEGDVCSWALLTYAILNATPLFPYQTDSACVMLIAKRQFTRFEKPKDVPEGIWSLLQDCWSEEPSERPSITDVVTKLQSLGSFN